MGEDNGTLFGILILCRAPVKANAIKIHKTMSTHPFKLLSISGLLLTIGLLSISSCNPSKRPAANAYGTPSKDSADNLNQTTFANDPLEAQSAEQISTLYLNSLYVTNLSNNALKRPLHRITGNVARYLLNEHIKFKHRLRAMATQQNITLPANISNVQQLNADKLQHEKGLDYESDYINKMFHTHQKIFALMQRLQQSTNDDLRNWSKRNLPRFDKLMDTLRAGRAQIDSLQIKT